jgi:hypothetical protein
MFDFLTSRCGICNNVLRRTQYRWKLDGKTVTVCPNCNRRLEGQKSRGAFGKDGKPITVQPTPSGTGCLGCLGLLVVIVFVVLCIGGLLSWLSPSPPVEQPPPASAVENRKAEKSPIRIASLPTVFPYQGSTPTQFVVRISTGIITVKPTDTFTVLGQDGDKVTVRLLNFEFPFPTQNVVVVQR